ncbi:MAG: hypothetical protein EOL88_02940 [Bacteroidia bacterium]|nr:hypothetical protein [Bacteroidia bacterium]
MKDRLLYLIKFVSLVSAAILMLFASSGVTIYRHYCSASNTTQVSLLIDLTACGHDEAAESCCGESHTDHNSCSVVLDSDEKAACCSTEKTIVRFTEKFEISKTEKLRLALIPSVFAVFAIDQMDPIPFQTIAHCLFRSGPPLKSGFELIRFLHQFKFHL